MRPVVTDRVEWCVSLSVCLSQLWSLQKQLNWLRCRLGCGLGWAQEIMIWNALIHRFWWYDWHPKIKDGSLDPDDAHLWVVCHSSANSWYGLPLQHLKTPVSAISEILRKIQSTKWVIWADWNHSRSSAISPFDRAHITFYSPFTETVCPSCTVWDVVSYSSKEIFSCPVSIWRLRCWRPIGISSRSASEN